MLNSKKVAVGSLILCLFLVIAAMRLTILNLLSLPSIMIGLSLPILGIRDAILLRLGLSGLQHLLSLPLFFAYIELYGLQLGLIFFIFFVYVIHWPIMFWSALLLSKKVVLL